MKTHPNGTAPASGPRGTRLGARGGAVGRGWQMIWDRLSRTEWMEGQALAEQAAHALFIQPTSMTALLHRMAAEGILERCLKHVDTEVVKNGKTFPAKRNRAHYRIADSVTLKWPEGVPADAVVAQVLGQAPHD